MTNQIQKLENVGDLKMVLAKQYQAQIVNYLGDDKKAMKFLSAVVSAVQRTPELITCDPTTLINSFMTMAQLNFLPSNVSGEAYVLPYNSKKGMEAQFQVGYQGWVTLFYRSGVKSVNAEIVRKKDKFSYKNGKLSHNPDIFSEDRGEAIGAYVIVELKTGGKVSKVMSKKEILTIGESFSKSYFEFDWKTKKKTKNVGKYTPWNPKNDPELWMWKKTVIKQIAKMIPKTEELNVAIAEDNKESNISEQKEDKENQQNRIEEAKNLSNGLTMGNFSKETPVANPEPQKTTSTKPKPKVEPKKAEINEVETTYVIEAGENGFNVYNEKTAELEINLPTKAEAKVWVSNQ